jgi:TetR/AcrR family transcriptional regulator, transcriptional repressor for nem operon
MTPDTRQKLVDQALHLFATKGYQATSVAEILSAAGANSGSLYHFFPTKQDLLVAVLERYFDGLHPMLLDPAWVGVSDPVERVFALLGRYRQMLVDTQFFYGCPIGSLALEFKEPDPAVRAGIARNFAQWTDEVERCISDARDRFPPSVSVGDLANFVLTTMEGGVMLSRTYGSIDAFDRAVAQLRNYFDLLMQVNAPAHSPRTGRK